MVACVAVSHARETKSNPKDGLKYVRIEPGTFEFGCSAHDDECFAWEAPRRRVRIEKAFWIGQTEVVQRAYVRVLGTNPSLYRGPDLPVERVSWLKATKYCLAVGMRLPSEAEWEYAARAGNRNARYAAVESVSWYDANSNEQTHPAAAKIPNAFGLYGMLGNVWEWVQDSYDVEPSKHILRGGSFYNRARELRVSNRLWAAPDTAHRNMGFRCAAD